MASDLLSLGTSGVLAQQRLLGTAGNNITNVNTPGYSRQRTELYTNGAGGGVDSSYTARVLDRFAQTELWRDGAINSSYSAYYTELTYTDRLFSDAANNVGVGLDNYFNGIHVANDAPSGQSGREGVLSSMDTMINRFSTLSSQLDDQYSTLNRKVGTYVDKINSLLSNINELNNQVAKGPGNGEDSNRLLLLDQRDEQIRQLSEYLDIRAVPQSDGVMLINLSSGESLVSRGLTAAMAITPGSPDPRETGIVLQQGHAEAGVEPLDLGGSLGGLFKARADLAPAQRQLGQLSVAMADAMNSQNRLGMTLNNELGSDLFALPTSTGLAFADNQGSGEVAVSFMAGQGSQLTANNYQVEFTGSNSYKIMMLDGDGKATTVATGTTPPLATDLPDEGISLKFSGAPVVGDRFLLQPTQQAAAGLVRLIRHGDELALASPLQLQSDNDNYGSASINLESISNTGSDSGFLSDGLAYEAPQRVEIDDSGNYAVYDGYGTLVGVAPASSNGKNIMANLENPSDGTKIYADASSNPGFEISITGSAQPGDGFSIAFNNNGFSDNYNGLLLANLQTKDLVRRSDSNSADNTITLNEAFTAMVTGVGDKTSRVKTEMVASEAKLVQSQEIYSSVSGVNLDEEAANLVRYQQAYAAAAQVVSVAKTIFDTILSAAR